MQNLPWDKPGRFWKGNLHCHTNLSDGVLPPAEAVAVYRNAGYDFVSLTDHFMQQYGYKVTDTTDLRTGDFTTLIGAELHAPQTELGEKWHILALGLPLGFAPTGPDETGPQLAARAAGAGAFIGIVHPAWYGLTIADAMSIEAAHAIEVYGTKVNARADSWFLSDALSARGRRLTAFAADDWHFASYADIPDPGGQHSWVAVRAGRLEPTDLLSALKAGHYYSTQGPEIRSVDVASGGELRLTCSPARAIHLTGRTSRCDYRLGDELVEATFSLEKFADSYCRLTITDANGNHAWSNPIWLDGIAAGRNVQTQASAGGG